MELLEKVRKALQDRKTSRVSEGTGIHPNTIRAIRNGSRKSVQLQTLQALMDYLEVA